MRFLKPVVLFSLLAGCVVLSCQPASAQGWLQKSTGIRTPEPIRKIAPNGISKRRVEESTSHLQVYTPGHIDSNGNVWSGTSNSGGTNVIVGKATIVPTPSGQAYWTYGNYPRVRAPQYDRRTSKPELLGREAPGNIELDNRVTRRKTPNSQSQGSQNIPNQNGMSQKQKDQVLLLNSIGQLVQGISDAAQQNQNQNQNQQQRQWGQPSMGGQQQWGQPNQPQPRSGWGRKW